MYLFPVKAAAWIAWAEKQLPESFTVAKDARAIALVVKVARMLNIQGGNAAFGYRYKVLFT